MAPAERSGSASVDVAAGALDLHEGIAPPARLPDPRAGGCGRWPEHLRLVNGATGEAVVGRCRATNLCRYCQQLYVVETLEMLKLDAAEYAPTLWLVLTAREHLTRAQANGHLKHLRTATRRRWPEVEWFVQVEFQRRGALHLNLLVKGVPVEELPELHDVVVSRWCARVDAEPAGQWSGRVNDAEGLAGYLQKTLSHGLKQEQAPPIGWRGHRTSQTRGYLVRPASVMRQEARAALKLKRELWRAIHVHGLEGEQAELAAAIALEQADAATWRLIALDMRMRNPEVDAGGQCGPSAGLGGGAEGSSTAVRRPPRSGGVSARQGAVSVALPAVAALVPSSRRAEPPRPRVASSGPSPSPAGVPPGRPVRCADPQPGPGATWTEGRSQAPVG